MSVALNIPTQYHQENAKKPIENNKPITDQ
nr:MAG TPA: hypothetical protein [Caudoviricetes sp.]